MSGASLPTCAGVPTATLSMFSHRLTHHDLCDNSHLSIVNGDRRLRLPLTTSTSRLRREQRWKEREIGDDEEGRQ